MLPPETDARGELTVRLHAKKEAYDILRSIRYMHLHEKTPPVQHIINSLQIRIPADCDEAVESHQSHSREDTGSRSTSNLPTPCSSIESQRKPPLHSHAQLGSPTSNGNNVMFINVNTGTPSSGRAKSALRKSKSLDAMLNSTPTSPSHVHNNNASASNSRPPSRGGFRSTTRPSTATGYPSSPFVARQDTTPPVTVRLTSHVAVLSSSPSSPIVTARLPGYIANISRPSTAGAINARKHAVYGGGSGGHGSHKKPQHVRHGLRSPKMMIQPAFS